MVSCAVSNCDVTRRNNPNNYTFHRLPSRPALRDKWIRIINRPNWTPSKNSTVCSEHFDEKCFIQRTRQRVLLKDSVPTLFVTIKLKQRRSVSSYVNRDITLPREELTQLHLHLGLPQVKYLHREKKNSLIRICD
ncbi:unnamed protein product [Parnassius apollo]|uniref:(apollo) hypothetical protein n=1 Tax=Parnassius apollo TaxID=110799 RepID=A0A8S3W9X7_PARAO|nr:unnamed protein product [Parnassius apollo]